MSLHGSCEENALGEFAALRRRNPESTKNAFLDQAMTIVSSDQMPPPRLFKKRQFLGVLK